MIELGLSRGRNAMAIWQDLVDGHGFAAGYQSVKRFLHKLRGSPTPEARVVIVTAPGEEAQVDYGTGPMVRDPLTGKYRRTRLFVLTLGHSRNPSGCWCSDPVRASGPNCTRKRFAGWAGRSGYEELSITGTHRQSKVNASSCASRNACCVARRSAQWNAAPLACSASQTPAA